MLRVLSFTLAEDTTCRWILPHVICWLGYHGVIYIGGFGLGHVLFEVRSGTACRWMADVTT